MAFFKLSTDSLAEPAEIRVRVALTALLNLDLVRMLIVLRRRDWRIALLAELVFGILKFKLLLNKSQTWDLMNRLLFDSAFINPYLQWTRKTGKYVKLLYYIEKHRIWQGLLLPHLLNLFDLGNLISNFSG